MTEAVLDAEAPTTTKVCSLCGCDRDIELFRRRHKDKPARHSECRTCRRGEKHIERVQLTRNERDRLRSQGKRQRDLAAFVTELARGHKDYALMVALVRAMTTRLGGLHQMVTIWHEALEKARKNPRASRFVGKSIWGIVELAIAVEKGREQLMAKRPPRIDPSCLNDEDLREVVLEYTKTIIEKDPRWIIRAAERMGWTFTRPDVDASQESA